MIFFFIFYWKICILFYRGRGSEVAKGLEGFIYKEKKREREIVRMYLARWREGEVARGLEVKGSRGKGVLRSRGREVLRSRG